MASMRKNAVEFALNVYSSEPTLVHPANLDEAAAAAGSGDSRLTNANIYLILKRPRIAFAPSAVRVADGRIRGEVSVQLPDGFRSFPFRITSPLPSWVADIRVSEYPHTKLGLVDDKGLEREIFSLTYLLRGAEVDLEGLDDQEVVYVGRAFGADGQRNAIDRLLSHSTLQKILAEISANEPNMEVLLALYCFEFHRFFLTFDPRSRNERSSTAESSRRTRALEAKFKRSMRIAVAEAALIRHFQPKYNKVYRDGFPSKRLKILQKLYELDFAALVVEASIVDHGMRIRSVAQPPLSHHIAQFNLHERAARRNFFFDFTHPGEPHGPPE
jgi:hypothetical protein